MGIPGIAAGNIVQPRDIAATVNGVPLSYANEMNVALTSPIIPGLLSKVRLRPAVLNEHAESSREIMGTVDAATAVGQMFKASQENINGIFLTLESAAAETTIDDIEYGGNDGNLQAAWVLAGTNAAVTEAVIISGNHSSAESMELDISKLNDSWTFTKPATSWNMTGATVSFDFFQTVSSLSGQVTVSINDGAATSVVSIPVAVDAVNTWQHFDIPITSFVGTCNIAAVTKVLFIVTNAQNNQTAYVDNVRFRAAPGSVSIELWDMGASLPANGGSVDYTAAGTQYTELGDRGIGGSVAASIALGLRGGKQFYHVHEFIAGVATEIPANNILTVGNYYALVIKYVDTNVSVYGPNTAYSVNYYTSGYAWKAEVADGLIDLLPGGAGAGAYSDLMFGILSTQPVYITKMRLKLFDSSDALTASAPDTESVWVVEDDGMKIETVALVHFLESTHEEDISANPIYMGNGGKAEIYYSSSVDDAATTAVFEISYKHEKPVVNG